MERAIDEGVVPHRLRANLNEIEAALERFRRKRGPFSMSTIRGRLVDRAGQVLAGLGLEVLDPDGSAGSTPIGHSRIGKSKAL